MKIPFGQPTTTTKRWIGNGAGVRFDDDVYMDGLAAYVPGWGVDTQGVAWRGMAWRTAGWVYIDAAMECIKCYETTHGIVCDVFLSRSVVCEFWDRG